ncbi:hypothetical protein E2C01_097993 [Portunus trituberculatus]|uniref:Uncharacterized protein n=1 Tax=Portunus trituberculatus TaxID=210409 RepID=A0A5B7K735_PORTR|nr:hypothetical protein [Portunus trituberculatus]
MNTGRSSTSGRGKRERRMGESGSGEWMSGSGMRGRLSTSRRCSMIYPKGPAVSWPPLSPLSMLSVTHRRLTPCRPPGTLPRPPPRPAPPHPAPPQLRSNVARDGRSFIPQSASVN